MRTSQRLRFLALLCYLQVVRTALCFTVDHPSRHPICPERIFFGSSSNRRTTKENENHPPQHGSTTRLYQSYGRRTDIKLPLLDLTESELIDDYIQPLPSSHLPETLRTPYIYGMKLTRPVHQKIVDRAIESPLICEGDREPMFGHIAHKPDPDSFLGAIGCASKVLLNVAEQAGEEEAQQTAAAELGQATTVVCQGAFRFVVKEVVSSIPYPVTVVDELLDDDDDDDGETSSDPAAEETEEDEDDEDEDDDDSEYADLEPADLVKRTMLAMKSYVDQKLEETADSDRLTLLEQSILELGGMTSRQRLAARAGRQAAEEAAAVFEVFQSSLVDLFILPNERWFALAFLAAELGNLDNAVRRKILRMTNSLERLRYVLQELEEVVRMERARKVANQITGKTDEAGKDLKVGQPELPPWARSIRKGTKVEYYWNEEHGWCRGGVVEDPVMVVDELIVTVHFEDGSTHRLPFRADEKVRWRPAQ